MRTNRRKAELRPHLPAGAHSCQGRRARHLTVLCTTQADCSRFQDKPPKRLIASLKETPYLRSRAQGLIRWSRILPSPSLEGHRPSHRQTAPRSPHDDRRHPGGSDFYQERHMACLAGSTSGPHHTQSLEQAACHAPVS